MANRLSNVSASFPTLSKGRGLSIAQIGVSFRIDSELKKEFEEFCDSIGISMTAAVHLFIKTTVREQRIPFEVSAKRQKK